MRDVVDPLEVEFLDGVTDTAADEELPWPAPRRTAARRWLVALGLAVLAVVALVVRGVGDRAGRVDAGSSPSSPGRSATAPNTSFTVLGPGGVYVEVPYIADDHPRLPGGDAGRLLDCAEGATCVVQRTLPKSTLAALRTAFPGLQVESAWTVLVVRPGARPQLQTRQLYGFAGSRSVEVEIRVATASDAVVRSHRSGVEGTRSVFTTVAGLYLVQTSVFERYESTNGVLDQLGSLVRGGRLMAVR